MGFLCFCAKEMNKDNSLTFACHFTANRNACPSTQKINIIDVKSE